MSVFRGVLGKVLYNSIAIRLPQSNAKITFYGKELRSFCGKQFLKHCGNDVNIEKGARIGGNVSLGNNSGIGINAYISSNVTIGNNVMMGSDCIIYTANHEFKNNNLPMIKQGFQKNKPVIIDDDVWIGGRVIILPGVHIHEGSIIGAGSIVTKDVAPYTIVAGNPAKVINLRRPSKINNS